MAMNSWQSRLRYRLISKRYMNILQSIQQLDGEILLLIQQYLRTDMLTPFMKSVTFLGNGGWFWILCAVVLLAVPKTRKTGYAAALSLIFGAIVTNLLLKNIVARPRPFAEVEALIPMIIKPKDFSFPSGHTTASFAVALVMLRMLPKKFGIPAVVLAALVAFSDRCSGRIRDRAGGKYAVSVDRANETGRQTGTLDCPEDRKI